MILPEVEKQLTQYLETSEHRKQTKAYLKRRADVASHYDRLKTANESLPTLPEFRQLPIMQVMQSKSSDVVKGIEAELKDSRLIKDVLKGDLATWTDRARADMAAILGFDRWRAARSKKKLHPVDRLTAWFVCKKCDEVAKKSRNKKVELLDFKAVCSHSCPHIKLKRRAQHRWSAAEFGPDEKVCSQILLSVRRV